MNLQPRTLRGQVALRLAASLLITLLFAAVLVSAGYGWWEARRQAASVADISSMIQHRLEARDQEGLRNARQIKTQIDLARILDAPAALRDDRLLSLFTALGEDLAFARIEIRDARGHTLFSHGRAAAEKLPLGDSPALVSGYYSARKNAYCRIITLPLWTGSAGGHILFSSPLDNGQLAQLAPLNTRLTLSYDRRILAESLTASRQRTPSLAMNEVDVPIRLQFSLPLYGEPGFLLNITQREKTLLTAPRVVMLAVGTGLLLAGLMWLTLGRWLGRLVTQLGALGSACVAFPKTHKLSPDIQAQLQRARRPDELGAVVQTLEDMMHTLARQDREARIHMQIYDQLDEAVLELDWDGRLQNASRAWLKLARLAHEDGEFLGHLHPDDRSLIAASIHSIAQGEQQQITTRVRLVQCNAGERWVECRLLLMLEGMKGEVCGILRDVTESHQLEQHITHIATHDTLTGLPNRILLEDRVKTAMHMATRDQRRVGMGFIDLDHFKQVNDSLGHKLGDRVLLAFSQRVQNSLRQGDTLARWGGDEFILLLPDMPDEAAMREVIDKLHQAFQMPLQVDAHTIDVTFSMGVAIYPDDAREADMLFAKADRATFHAKEMGRNSVSFFSDLPRADSALKNG